MKYLSIQELRELDRKAAEENGIPLEVLMENAGQAVAVYIKNNYPVKTHPGITVVCGKGNNGGDGLVAARYLADWHYQVNIIMLTDPKELKNEPLSNFKKLPAQIKITNYVHYLEKNKHILGELIQNSNLLVDAIFGTGLSGPITEHYADIICACNFAGKPIVAVDIPSGINGDNGPTSDVYIKPTDTVTFVAKKLAMRNPEYQDIFGKIEVADIGISNK